MRFRRRESIFPVVLILAISIALSSVKNNEECKAAYAYVVESNTFRELGVSESKIIMNGYSYNRYREAGSDTVTESTEISCIVRFRSFEVIGNREDGVWQVCEACADFD